MGMINSLIKEIEDIKFPDIWMNEELYMFPIDIEMVSLIQKTPFFVFSDSIEKMLSLSPIKKGIAYVTIDQKEVEKNKTHRRGGPHVDGNYFFSWGSAPGWLCGDGGRQLSPEKHKLQYENENGGFLMASSYSACRAWMGKYDGSPEQGGNCSHIKLDEGFLLKANKIYLGNSTCIHESLPLPQKIKRTLIRITLPATSKVL